MPPKPPSKAQSDRTTPDRYRAILSAAGDVFRVKGFQRATTLDIATAAGISKRDLYALFPSKDALLDAMIRSGTDEMTAPVTLTPATSRAAFYGALAAFGSAFLGMLLSPKVVGMYRLAISEAPTSATLGRTLRESGARRTTEQFTEFVAAAEAAGHVRFANREATVGVYFFALIGDLQMRALLMPSDPIGAADIARYAGLAIMALQRMEEPPATPHPPQPKVLP